MHRTVVFLIPLLLLVACSDDPQVTALLDRADSLTCEQPDSALRLLQQHEAEAATWSRSLQMRHALLTARAQNKAFVPFTADSVLLEVTDYYDRHGTPNQQLEAHYLLGCAYRDLGEAPRAIDAYQDAIDRSDTTAIDCDYRTLGCVYSQMADICYLQDLMDYFLTYLDKSVTYTYKAGDTLSAVNSRAQRLPLYYLQENSDSVIAIFKEIQQKYTEKGHYSRAAQYAQYAMWAMTAKADYTKAEEYMRIYERESGYFQRDGSIIQGREVYYYLKGMYFYRINKNDSAEYYFRKELHDGKNYMNQNAAALGLALLYSSTGQADSAAKYALYSYRMNDSVHFQKVNNEIVQSKSLYDYTRFQREAKINQEKAEQNKRRVRILLYIIVSIVLTTAILIYIIWKKKRYEAHKLQELKGVLAKEQSKILLLRSHEETLMTTIKNVTAENDELYEQLALLHQLSEEKETVIEKLEIQLKDSLQEKYVEPINSDESLEASPIYQRLQKKAIRGETISEDEWEKIHIMLIDNLPSFNSFIMNKMYALTSSQHHICVLLRLHVSQASISKMLGVTSPYISKMCKSILKKFFGSEGTGKDLERELLKIH